MPQTEDEGLPIAQTGDLLCRSSFALTPTNDSIFHCLLRRDHDGEHYSKARGVKAFWIDGDRREFTGHFVRCSHLSGTTKDCEKHQQCVLPDRHTGGHTF